jgi:hypothetical protein
LSSCLDIVAVLVSSRARTTSLRAHRETLVAIVEASTYDPEVAAFWQAFHDRFWDIATRCGSIGQTENRPEIT